MPVLDYELPHSLLDIIQNRTNYYNEIMAKKFEIYKNSFLDNFQDENYDESFINNLENPSETPQVVARVVEWIIKRIVRLRTLFVSGLRINILSPTNRDLLQGQSSFLSERTFPRSITGDLLMRSLTKSLTFLANYSFFCTYLYAFSGKIQVLAVKFDKIGYGQLLVTGGGRLLIEGIELRMRRFLLGLGSSNLSLRSSYRIFGDFLLTQRFPLTHSPTYSLTRSLLLVII